MLDVLRTLLCAAGVVYFVVRIGRLVRTLVQGRAH